MADILALDLHHVEKAVLKALELALKAGPATKMYVPNLLLQLFDGRTEMAQTIDGHGASATSMRVHGHHGQLGSNEWGTAFGDAKMTTALLDQPTTVVIS